MQKYIFTSIRFPTHH